jgi:hypothetical protein
MRRSPSDQFLREGKPTAEERRAIETLTRRRDFLQDDLKNTEEHGGSSYDRAEAAALTWALALIARLWRERANGS